jgi:hypothetical protein
VFSDLIKWSNANEGFLNLIGLVVFSSLFPFIFWIQSRIKGWLRRARSDEEIRRIETIRSEFYRNLKFIGPLVDYGPVLIRDVARDRLYFNGDEREFEKGRVAPSFKAQLCGVTVHGIRVYAGPPERIKRIVDRDTWSLAAEDDPDGKVMRRLGTIPFSSIVAVNWHGDPAHTFPHVYCHYDGIRGTPFKVVEFCDVHAMQEGWSVYEPMVDVDKVIQERF